MKKMTKARWYKEILQSHYFVDVALSIKLHLCQEMDAFQDFTSLRTGSFARELDRILRISDYNTDFASDFMNFWQD